MTDSSTTSRDRPDFAPSWLLRNSNHSPTPPPFRSVPTASPRDEWDRPVGGGSERKVQNGSRFQFHDRPNGDLQSENYFNYGGNGHGRISEYEQDGFLRRSNSINAGLRHNHSLPSRNNGHLGQQNNWNGRPKFDSHFRNGGSNGAGNGPFRESHVNSNGISYSIVTSKGLKPGAGPISPVLQQSDFPSLNLNPPKVEPTKCAQNTVWGNPPHLAKVMKRSLSNQSYMESGGTILGPHYGKGFFLGTRGRDLKLQDDFDALNSGSGDGLGVHDFHKSDFAEHSSTEDDSHQENITEESHADQDGSRSSDHEDDWTLSEVPRREKQPEHSMLSSTGSTGSVESIDSHHSNLSGGAAMMVEDLLDDFISEEEKLRIFHALEEIKERTGSESYYERVALTESRRRGQRRFPFIPDNKEEDDEDPDDRFLK